WVEKRREYYNRHVPTEPIECPCGAPIQTRKHILQLCPRFDQHRHILEEASAELNLETLLGTQQGIMALADFIKATKAFTKQDFNRRGGTQDG
ncbi:hypothetical protein FRC03_006796, partial [Tulasnella sp. 419]